MPIDEPVAWFQNLPFVLQLTVVGLGLGAVQQARQGYMGRVTIAGAGILVAQQAYPHWSTLEPIWRYYTIGGVLFGLIAGISYLTDTSLPTEFYRIALILYGAVSVILVLLFGFPI